jgi:cardiolipin synthase C
MPKARLLPCVILLACLTGCASLIPGAHYPKKPSVTALSPQDTELGRHFRDAIRDHGERSGLYLIPVGVDGFLTRIEMINAAERTLDLQYYIFRGDETGSLVRDALRRAAARGVHIRILVDDADTLPGDEDLFDIASVPNIEIRVYNPWAYRGHLTLLRDVEYLFRHPRLDYRMHNKLLVVDDAIALVGGRNIGDQYFQIDPGSQFADDDVFTVGAAVPGLEQKFDEFWNSELAIPSQALSKHQPAEHSRHRKPHLTDSQLEQAGFHYHQKLTDGEPFASLLSGQTPLVWAEAQVVCDSPKKSEIRNGARAGSLMYDLIANEVKSVQRELLMTTPYLVPSPGEMRLLLDRRSQNARVAILTNSLQSAPEISAQAGYMHYRPTLLRAGVELYEVRPNIDNTRGSGQSKRISRFGNYALHGKLLVFDRKDLYIGSMNFDRRSRHLNTEIGLIIKSPELSVQTVKRFDGMTQPESAYHVTLRPGEDDSHPKLVWETRENGRTVVYDKEPARSSWQRFKVRMISFLPIDSEL